MVRKPSRKTQKTSLRTHEIALVGMVMGIVVGFFSYHVLIRCVRSNCLLGWYQKRESISVRSDLKKEKLPFKIATAGKVHIPIVMYHYVDKTDRIFNLMQRRMTITPKNFEMQLREFVEEGYSTYFVRDIPDILTGKLTKKEKSVVLTFDDGYDDVYAEAFPLLNKYHVKATIYIMYNYIGKKDYLTDKQLRTMLESGLIEIGSHTLDHVALKNASRSVLHNQIVLSKKKLEDAYSIKVETFAYPYGVFDEGAIEYFEQAGYSAGVSVMYGADHSAQNLYHLRRVDGPSLGVHPVEALEKY